MTACRLNTKCRWLIPKISSIAAARHERMAERNLSMILIEIRISFKFSITSCIIFFSQFILSWKNLKILDRFSGTFPQVESFFLMTIYDRQLQWPKNTLTWIYFLLSNAATEPSSASSSGESGSSREVVIATKYGRQNTYPKPPGFISKFGKDVTYSKGNTGPVAAAGGKYFSLTVCTIAALRYGT